MPDAAYDDDDVENPGSGRPDDHARLFATIYQDLRKRAQRLLADNEANSLNTTGLVHEAYLKLSGATLSVASKAHFFHIAAAAMRQIVVDHARYRQSQCRDWRMIATMGTDFPAVDDTRLVDVIALDSALASVRLENERSVQVVELHFFAGLSFPEIAELQNTSLSTVERDWRTARALLYVHMHDARP